MPTTSVQRVCVDNDGNVLGIFDPKAQSGPTSCWTTKDWVAYMKNHNWKAANGTLRVIQGVEVGVNLGGQHGNQTDECTRTDDGWLVRCDDPSVRIRWAVDPPRVVEKTIATPCPSPTPGPLPTPTPGPGGCPGLYRVGGMFLTAVDCGNCRKQGYLGVRVNYTATELCKEGDPGCVCDPARNRCEMPRQCQNPNGADTFITLAGHFTNDECDRNSDNYFNCHHKPKKDETGVTLFTSTPWQEPKNPWDPRGVTNCVDVQEHGTKQIPREDPRCKAALAAAGR